MKRGGTTDETHQMNGMDFPLCVKRPKLAAGGDGVVVSTSSDSQSHHQTEMNEFVLEIILLCIANGKIRFDLVAPQLEDLLVTHAIMSP